MKVPPPDWGRYASAVRSRAQDSTGQSHTPLGDPTKWGGTDLAELFDPAPDPTRTFAGQQFLRVQALDTYSRSWALVGTLQVVQAMWAVPAADWTATLEVTQGVGQATIVQQLDLRLLTTIGLAVYRPQIIPVGAGNLEVRSFAAIGALIGQQLAMRIIHTVIAGSVIKDTTTTVLVTPFAAGSGL